jgi:hypothetical protein
MECKHEGASLTVHRRVTAGPRGDAASQYFRQL